MNILYHLATLPPKLPKAEAISQEITALLNHFKGAVKYINPNQLSPLYIPRFLFGFHQLKHLRESETNFDLHHFYNPDPFPFFYLRMLKQPVIYSITCGVSEKRPNHKFFSSLAAIAVADERSLKRLKDWGFDNVFLVRTGIDVKRFTVSPLPLHSEIRLMVGSAPWTKAQFYTKGVEALLEAAKLNRQLRLTFLWRGVLSNEIVNRVQQKDLEGQVTIIDKQVDVNQVLAQVHASITLATEPGIIKAYPHSLLDSLAAGKPILVSRAIPMADYVEKTKCGQVVESVRPDSILAAVEALARAYQPLQKAAQCAGQRDFSQRAMIDSYQKLYNATLHPTH